ncbi:MAG: sulfatase-like hydrolase/transferase [Gammaproteobacteria bacterium]|nr:sulfatase-like hydrolase/transferase [Gammaproteobacteria bacterium]
MHMLKKSALLSVCAASAVFSVSPLSQAIAQELQKPNFVTIIIDDMGFSDLGYFGGEVPTPNLDQLAGDSIALTNFYASATSTPSRAMLFTGKDSHQVGLGSMGGFMYARGDEKQSSQPGYEGVLSKDVPTFAEVLQTAGYQTMMTGKWDMSEKPGGYAHDRGFEITKGLLLPGGDIHYLSDANGQNITTRGNLEALGRTTPYNENGQEVTEFPANAYSTDYYTDSAIAMLHQRDASRPFYLNVSHIATHTPWQAPAEIVAKYFDTYAKGWDVLRAERFERQKAAGFFPANAQLPPRPEDLRAWNSLTAEDRAEQASRMAVYAAMIEMLDNSVGRLVQHLKDSGDYDNTAFLVYSDNGAETFGANMGDEDSREPLKQRYNIADQSDGFEPVGGFVPTTEFTNMGGPDWIAQGNREWAMLSNIPYNKHKVTFFEGGMHTMFFMHYPQSTLPAVKYDCMHSVMDIAPTLIEMGGAVYPDTWNGEALSPMQGVSMAGLFNGNFSCDATRYLAWEFDGMKAVRQGGWALSQNRYDENWYLFDLEADPYEQIDVASQHPDKLNEMLGYYRQYADENGVFDVSGRWLAALQSSVDDGYLGIYGGVAVNETKLAGTFPFWRNNLTPGMTDDLDVSGFIRFAKEDVGQTGTVFAYGRFTPAQGGGAPLYFALTENGMHFQATPVSLPPYKQDIALPGSMPVAIYAGRIGVPGKVEIMMGYQVDGKELFNTEMLTFTITAS